jgi:hypothetical protein
MIYRAETSYEPARGDGEVQRSKEAAKKALILSLA